MEVEISSRTSKSESFQDMRYIGSHIGAFLCWESYVNFDITDTKIKVDLNKYL